MVLSDISIKNPVFAWMLMIGILVFGWIGFTHLGISQLPDVDFPVVTVTIAWEGAAPEVVETDVTDVLEDALMSAEGVKEVTSVSQLGQSRITVEFDMNRNVDAAVQDIQSRIAEVQKNLPNDIDPPVIRKTNPEDQPIIMIGLSGGKSLKDLDYYTNDFLKEQFTTIPGVGDIGLGGYVDPNLRVWLNSAKMKQKEITVEDVVSAIGSQHADLPSGYIDKGSKETNVRVYGEAATPEEFTHILIPERVRGGPIFNNIQMGDVGSVENGLNDIRTVARTHGFSAVGLQIQKQRGANAVAVADAIKQRVKEVQKILPKDMRLTVVFDQTQFIKDAVHELKFNLLLAIILTSLVCYFFLGSIGATVNVLLAIPTSLMGAFFVIYFLGFTINTFTMLGLSLVIGIVVDDAIMVLENIARHQEMGADRRTAALEGTREITFAAIACSIAILAIFVPVIFMQGVIGKFFFQFGVTISVAVMFSLLEAITITPMRCSQFLDVGHTTRLGKFVERGMKWLTQKYRSTLELFLDHRKAVLVIATIIFASSLFLTKAIKKEFIPPQDQSRFVVRLILSLGSSIEKTGEVFDKAESFLLKQPEVVDTYGVIGANGGQVNQGLMFITMKPKEERPIINGHRETQFEFMDKARKTIQSIPGIDRVSIQDLSLRGFTAQRGFPVEFTIRGPDWDKLGDYSREIIKQMKASGFMTDVDTDYWVGMPELQIHPDRKKAEAHGVSIFSIADTINSMVGGVRSGKFTSNGKRYDIRVRLVDADRTEPKDINGLWVRNQFGEVVPLSDVVTYDTKPTLFSVTRKNRERAISIYANPAAGHSQQEALDKVTSIAKQVLPQGYRMVLSGGSQAFAESNQSLIFALILGIFVAYMVLATQFNSFLHPVTVLLALPFSVAGAFLALFLTHNTLNLYSMIGLILLMGIVKKNSILLVDFTNVRRQKWLEANSAEGHDPSKPVSDSNGVKEALLEACPIRFRPILMTSVATIAAAIPIALSFGSGSETTRPMAVAVVGGVAISTLLTLFVVPCAYMVFSRFERHSKKVK